MRFVSTGFANVVPDYLPPIEEGAEFSIPGTIRLSIDHPFMIGAAHVSEAADRRLPLGERAINASGVGCRFRYNRDELCNLSLKAHKPQLGLLLLIGEEYLDNTDAVPGLCQWLAAAGRTIEETKEDKITKFVFVTAQGLQNIIDQGG